jgi:integrase
VKKKGGLYQLDIRDQRLRGGRLACSARTSSAPVARKREAALRTLLDRGMAHVLERMRSGDLHIADVQRLVETGDFDRLLAESGEQLTVADVMDRAVRVAEATTAEGTAKQYRMARKQLLAVYPEGTPAASIGIDEAEAFLHRPRGKRQKPWSARSQAQRAAIYGRAWSDAIRREAEASERNGTKPRLSRNPWRLAARPEVRATRFAFLLPEEWQRLYDSVEGRAVAVALAFGVLAGLRLREVIHLRRDIDVELDARRLHIQPRDGVHPWRPKTANSVRSLRIGDELARIVQAHIDSGFAGARYLIVTPGDDRPMSPSTLARWTETAFRAAGIAYGRAGDALTFHSLRHTFASWLVQRDVQLKKVSKLLGNTTEQVDKVYGHLLPTDLDRVVDLVTEIAGLSSESSSGKSEKPTETKRGG